MGHDQTMALRENMLARLKETSEYDVLVIGGGLTGLAVAFDASTRGYTVLVVDAQDWGQGGIGRSSKLMSVQNRSLFKPNTWTWVRDALQERAMALRNAPDMVRPQTVVVPCMKRVAQMMGATRVLTTHFMDVPAEGMENLFVQGKAGAMGLLPGVTRQSLFGAIGFGQAKMDDNLVWLTLLMEAVEHGALAINHMAVTGFERDARRVTGVELTDRLSGSKYRVSADVIINCAGVWVDEVRAKLDVEVESLVRTVRGTHIVVDRSFLPSSNALMVSRGAKRSPLVCLPFMGQLVIGQTEVIQRQAPFDPQTNEDEIYELIQSINQYLTRTIRRSDVLGAFSGLRAVFDAQRLKLNTGQVLQGYDFGIVPEFGNFLTIAGSGLSTYRLASESALSVAIQLRLIDQTGCKTRALRMTPAVPLSIYDMQRDMLSASFWADHSVQEKVTEAVHFFMQYTQAQTVQDCLTRRWRLALMHQAVAQQAEPYVQAAIDTWHAQLKTS